MSETPDQIARTALLERIRKLQRMTTDRGAGEHEALQAAAIAARLINEHQVSQSELQIRLDAKHCIKDALTYIGKDPAAWRRVAISIERLFGTICWVEQSKEDPFEMGFTVDVASVVYYGFPLDVAGSIATLAIIAQALDTGLESQGRVAKVKRESFEIGFCDRINERLKEMRQRSQNAFREASKGALVVLKDQLVREEFSKMGVKLRRSSRSHKTVDSEAYSKGRASGGIVGLDPRVSGQEQRRLG